MSAEEKDSFVFYRSFYKAINYLTNDLEKLEMYEAVTKYALDFTEPTLKTPMQQMAWDLMRPQLLANKKRYENGCKPKRKTKKKAEFNEEPKKEEFIRENDPNARAGDFKVVNGKRYWYQNNYWCEEVS